MGTEHARLRRPAVTALGGSAIAVASLVSSGWGDALIVQAVTVLAAIGYYLLGGRDSDFGAMIGSQTDERQATIGCGRGPWPDALWEPSGWRVS